MGPGFESLEVHQQKEADLNLVSFFITKALSQKDIACFAACHAERPLPFDVQLIVQLFALEMLDTKLVFRIPTFCPSFLPGNVGFKVGF